MASRAQEIDVKLLLFAIQRTTTFENLLAQKFIPDSNEVRNQIWFPVSCTLMAIWINNLNFWDNSWVPGVSIGTPIVVSQPLGFNLKSLCSIHFHVFQSISACRACTPFFTWPKHLIFSGTPCYCFLFVGRRQLCHHNHLIIAVKFCSTG